ncbi:DALR domain-containing protein, partial [Agrococcus sp. HG114]|uniref:DALR domain-containing protein n=1 Tax=Agrococcus sp. HG114 TaxID=2969757 RepID=UPI002810E470
LKTACQNLKHRRNVSANLADDDTKWLAIIEQHIDAFKKEMDDDFNSADGITVLFELAKQANVYLRGENTSTKVIDSFLGAFEDLFSVLGLEITQTELLDEEIDQLIEQRLEARKNRNFALADQIRDQLKEMNII